MSGRSCLCKVCRQYFAFFDGGGFIVSALLCAPNHTRIAKLVLGVSLAPVFLFISFDLFEVVERAWLILVIASLVIKGY